MSVEAKLEPIERALYELMSYVSEDCYCAGWMDGTEYALWQVGRLGRESWGQGPSTATRSIVESVVILSDLIDRWIVWEDGPDEGPKAVTLEEFRAIYNDWARS